MKIVVIGAGLIGTSIALGVKRAGAEVELIDLDGRAEKLANDLVSNGKVRDPDLVVIATPTSSVHRVIEEFKDIYPKSTFIDIGSTKTKVKVDVQTFGDFSKRFVPTHPMAGREVDGAEGAQSDLFQGKTWVVTPLEESAPESLKLVSELIESLGARVKVMEVAEHDQVVALVSHLPQIISSLLAAQLDTRNSEELSLAGSGVLDTTRIAGSNPDLWREILDLNKEPLLPLLQSFQNDLSTLIKEFNVQEVLERGRSGRAKLPGKHKSAARNYTYLPVVIDDKPNQLAALFDECAKANVNVEDLSIEHSPEQETGLVILALSEKNATVLQEHLSRANWRVHPPRSEK